MKHILITILLLVITLVTKAQDMIVKINQDEIKAKVLEVSEDAIKYKKWEMQDGPTYSIKAADVFMIIYKNGTRETIKQKEKKFLTIAENENEENPQTNDKTSSKENTKTISNSSSSPFTFYPQFIQKKNGKFAKYATFADFGTDIKSLINAKAINLNIHNCIFLANNIGLEISDNISYVDQAGLSVLGTNITGGISYYLNDVLKLDKTKASFYVAPKLGFSFGSILGDNPYNVDIPYTFNFVGAIGARYHVSQKLGIHTEINANDKAFNFIVGLSILRLKDNNLKNSQLKKSN